MTDHSREGGFLARWSRRKREAAGASEPSTEEISPATAPVSEEDAARAEEARLRIEEEEAANRAAAEAVDIEELDYQADFSVFLKSGVPAALRRKAMRKLWTSNPVLANLDGLNDYDTDFRDPKFNVFNSIWQVGRGYLTPSDEKGTSAAATDHAPVSDPAADETGAGYPATGAEELSPASSSESVPADSDPQPEMPDTRDRMADIGPANEENREEAAEPVRVSIRRRLMG